MIRFYFIVLLLLLPLSIVYGVSNEFTVRTYIGTDTEPPSTPILQSLQPLSTTQIALFWSTSTDNILLQGYNVLRDSVVIATTTNTYYVDSGLTASTSYIYSVRAFDSVFNISTTSNALATSTFSLAATSTPVVDTSSYGSKNTSSIAVSVTKGIYDAELAWSTKKHTRFVLRYGVTDSYEIGSVAGTALRQSHRSELTGLLPATTYYFELVAYDATGSIFGRYVGSFKTLKEDDSATTPSNVRNVTTYVAGDTVHLSWQNPDEEDFSHVRVVRSHLFYPQSPSDGFLVSESNRESVTDKEAFLYGPIAYYTIFSYDHDGNVSSGAVTVALRDGATTPLSVGTTTATSSFSVSFSDIVFIQEGKVVAATALATHVPVLVRIPYEKLPMHLKTVVFVVEYGAADRDTYLLRSSEDKKYYEARIQSVPTRASLPAHLVVYDFTTKIMHTESGVLVFSESKPNGKNILEPLRTTLAVPSEVFTFLFFLVVLYIVSYLLFLRKRKKALGSP